MICAPAADFVGFRLRLSLQVVHCDLKAANILTTKNGNVKLSDFGVSLNLVAVVEQKQKKEKDVAGTPNWSESDLDELIDSGDGLFPGMLI